MESFITDFQIVVSFIPAADAFENFDGLLDSRLFNHHRLEATLQSGVPFDVLTILFQCRGPDTLQLTPGQGRL